MTKLKVFLIVLLLVSQLNGFQINNVSTSPDSTTSSMAGSTMGGTTIYIKGTGFKINDSSKTTIMVGSYPCNIAADGVSATTIACETTSTGFYSSEYNLKITVSVEGEDFQVAADTFSYKTASTPYLYAITPSIGYGDNMLYWYGVHRIYNLGDGRSDTDIIGLYIGNSVCSIFDLVQSDINSNGAEYIQSYQPKSQKGGKYSIQEHVIPGYSFEYTLMTKSTLGSSDEYQFIVMPAIQSFTSSGAIGGNQVTISGTGFSPMKSEVSVSIDNVPCAVTTSTVDEIICTLQQKVSQTSEMTSDAVSPLDNFESGAGFKYQRYDMSAVSRTISNLKNVVSGMVLEEEAVKGQIKTLNTFGTKYGQSWKGYFVASVDGTYTFRGIGDDIWAVYLSNATYNSTVVYGDADTFLSVGGAQSFATFPNYYDTDYGVSGQNTLQLVAYNRYYMEVYHINGAGAGYFELGIEVPNTDTTIQKWQSYEVQKFQTKMVSEPQIISYKVSGLTNGTIFMSMFERDNSFKVIIDENATIPFDATASQFCTALNQFSIYKSYSISCELELLNNDLLVETDLSLVVYYNYIVSIDKLRSQSVAAKHIEDFKYYDSDSVQYTAAQNPTYTSIQDHSPLFSGTFTITLGGSPILMYSSGSYSEANLPYNIAAYTLQSAIRKLNGLAQTRVQFRGDYNYGGLWIIYYIAFNQDIPDLVFTTMNLMGGSNQPTIQFTTRRDYSPNLLVQPMDYRFMSTTATSGSIRVTVNDIPSACLNDCTYTFNTNVPQVTASTLTDFTLALTLSDPNTLAAPLTDITVTLDGQSCVNLVGTMTSFTCDLPKNADDSPQIRAGDYFPLVFIAGTGTILMESSVVAHSFTLSIASLSPTSGGQNGGYDIDLVGTGFPFLTEEITFELCGSIVTIKQITNVGAKIIAPPCATSGAQTVTATYGTLTATSSFTYEATTAILEITSIDPISASPVLKAQMVITGSGFGIDKSLIEVWLTNSTGNIYQMRVLELSDTSIKTGISGGLPGQFDVNVIKTGDGNAIANPTTANDFIYEVLISSVSPSTGSVYGGTLLTITGTNFIPDDKAESMVTIGNQLNQLCTIETITKTEITCRTPVKHQDDSIQTNLIVLVNNKLIIDSTCSGTCDFQYANETTGPLLNSISQTSMTIGELILDGQNFDSGSTCEVTFYNRVTKAVTVVAVNSFNTISVNVTVPSLESGYYYVGVRTDPVGQSNPKELSITMVADTISPSSVSVFGGKISITGSGFPITWPNKHFNALSLVSDGMNMILDIESTSSDQIVLNIPKGYNGKEYTFTIQNIHSQKKSRSFSQTNAATPTVTLSSTASVAPGTISILLETTILSSTEPETVAVYSVTNPNSMTSVTSFTYTDPNVSFDVILKSGKYGFKLYDNIYGWYNSETFLTVTQTGTYTVSTFQTSFNGGQVTVSGADISEGATVTVNGQVGTYVSNTPTQAIFNIPKLITPNTQTSFSLAINKTINLDEKVVWGDSEGWENAFDNEYGTSYSSDNAVCSIGIDIGENLGAYLTRIRFFPFAEWSIASNMITGGKFQVSNDNSSWSDIATIDQTVHAGWNTLMIVDQTIYRYVRFLHGSDSQCKLLEFQLTGIVMSSTVVSDVTLHASDLTFNDGVTEQVFASVVQYRKDYTPIITAVSPKNGDVYGGYAITLTGVYLDVGTPIVMIDGQQCVVTSSTAVQIICDVPQRLSIPDQITFTVQVGASLSIIEEPFRYVMRWSDIRTWGTDLPPIDDDMVYVPKGMHLLVDESTPVLKAIVVEDGIIEFSDESDMVIQSEMIIVRGGKFIAGTEDSPYQYDLTFIMHGNYWLQQLPIFGNKVIGCFECDFSMIGKTRLPTWSQLAATVNVGDQTFEVEDTIDWVIGQVIVVASTSYNHHEAEQKTITGVSGKVVTVDTPFKYVHFGAVQTYGNDSITMRAEVGLLTRNIKVMGDDDSVAQDYGSHLLLAGSSENGLRGRIAYTEFTKCGQPQIVGRYCHHFHMNGDVPDSYSKGNAVHHSMARILTIHGVHFLNVKWNVGYKVKGHNFFIEDGIETNNVVEYNLAISSLSVNNMMQTDISVASYWVTNPFNHLRFNRAAGGDFYGFWYELKRRPDGPSATEDVCPEGNPLGQSHDNIAHSYLRFGLRILRLASRTNPCGDLINQNDVDIWAANPTQQARFYNYVLYKNGQAGLLAEKTGHTIFENFVIAENVLAGMEFYLNNLTREDVKVINMTIIGKSTSNFDTNASKYNGFGAILPRSGNLYMQNIRFYQFTSTQTMWQACSHCDNLLLYTNFGAMYTSKQIKYTGVNASFYNMLGLKRQIFYDLDGSLTNGVFDANTRGASTLIFGYAHLSEQTECMEATTSSEWADAIVCENMKIKQIMFTNAEKKSQFDRMPIKIKLIDSMDVVVPQNQTVYTSTYGVTGTMEPHDSSFSWSLPYAAGRIYNVWWGTGIDFTHMAMVSNYLYGETDDAILFKFNYTKNRQLYEIGSIEQNIGLTKSDYMTQQNAAIDKTSCGNGDFYHNNSEQARVLHMCASGKERSQFQYISINAIYCIYLCPAAPGQFEKEYFVRRWSNATQWPLERMPLDGQNVTIPGPWKIIMDVQPAVFNFLEVEGDIIIENIMDINITANNVWVKSGSITVGNKSEAYTYNLVFQINGQKQDLSYTVDAGLTANKLFVVTGDLHLYGSAPSTTWTVLKEFAHVGDNSITVSSVSGWVIGDEIVIAPTFTGKTQFEKVTITAINSKTVTFTPSLEYNHYGAASSTIEKEYGTLDTRARVGHLTRNIKFVAGADSGWGYTLVQYGFMDTDTDVIKTGNLILKGVEFVNGGQYDTEEAALMIKDIRINTTSTLITDSTFHNCQDFCMNIDNAYDVEITNNVFYNAKKFHVQTIDMFKFKFSNNLMIGALKRTTTVFQDFIACFQSYKFFDSKTALVSVFDNVCQGSEGHGFAIPTVPCQDIDIYPFSRNTVGSTQIGFILGKSSSTCVAAKGLMAYSSEIGQMMNPGTQETQFKHFIMTDNNRGLTLRIGGRASFKTAFLNDSYIAAISRPDCAQCYASGNNKCSGTHGIRMLTTGSNTENMPEKFGSGFDVVCAAETIDAKVFIYNVEFANFKRIYSNQNLTECKQNVIFIAHQGATDITGSHHLWNSTCTDCELSAMATFRSPKESQLGWFGGCGVMLCTGFNNYMITDHSGTLLPEKGMLLANNSWIGDGQTLCEKIDVMNGHYCKDVDYGVLTYHSIAPDHNLRIMWPIYLNYEGGNWTSVTNAWIQWSWEGGEPLNKRKGRFLSVVKLHQTYNMTFTSEPPTDMIFKIQKRLPTGNESDWAIIKLHYPRPNSIRVQANGVTIKPISLLDNNGEQDIDVTVCGSNKFFYKNYTIHFAVNGAENCRIRVTLVNSIQLTARFSMPIDDFFNSDGPTKFINRMSALLGITDTSRVKIVGAYSGSTLLTVSIDAADSAEQNSTSLEAATAEEQATQLLLLSVGSVLSNGSFSSAMEGQGFGTVQSVSASIVLVSEENTTEESNLILIIGMVLGMVLIVCLVVISAICYMRKRAKIGQIRVEQIPISSQTNKEEGHSVNNKVVSDENYSIIDLKVAKKEFY